MAVETDAVITDQQRRAAFAFGAALLGIVATGLFLRNVSLPRYDATAVLETVIAGIGGLLTALILFNLAMQGRSARIGVLASGYLFAGLISAFEQPIYAYARTFLPPGNTFQAGGFLFCFTYAGFAISIFVSAFMLDRRIERAPRVRRFIVATVAATIVAAFVAVRFQFVLPALFMPNGGLTGTWSALLLSIALIDLAACVLLVRNWSRLSAVDTWLAVVALCNTLVTALAALPYQPDSIGDHLNELPEIAGWLILLIVGTYEIGWLREAVTRSREGVRQRDERLAFLLGQMPAILWTMDRQLKFTSGLGAGLTKLGLQPNQLAGVPIGSFIVAPDHPAHDAHRRALKGQEVRFESEFGGLLHECCVRPLTAADGAIEGVIGFAFDVTERKTAEAQIERLLHFDELTGLPNRVLLRDRIDNAIARSERDSELVAVVSLTIDGFKTISEAAGNSVGDRLLCTIAARLAASLHDSNTLSRPAGDIFTVVLAARTIEEVAASAKRLLSAFDEPVTVGSGERFLRARMGIALAGNDGRDAETLINASLIAMERARNNDLSRFAFYRAEMQAAVSERLDRENDLHRGLRNREFTVYYQPIVNCRTGLVVGAEALSRWRHPDHGVLPADQWVGLAEEIGLISEISELALHAACRQGQMWNEGGHAFGITVNLAAAQCQNPKLPEIIAGALRESRLAPHLLQLEITESGVMQEPAVAAEILSVVKQLDVRLSIDDFGTGYSSLSYLKRFPFDTLKIDKSFISDIVTDRHFDAIVGAVISLARRLGLDTIAEGVEHQSQLDHLRMLECESYQGYLFGPPVDPAMFIDLAQQAKAS